MKVLTDYDGALENSNQTTEIEQVYEKLSIAAEKLRQLTPIWWKEARPLKNGNLCSSSRKAKISTTGIYRIFRGLKFEPDAGTLVKR